MTLARELYFDCWNQPDDPQNQLLDAASACAPLTNENDPKAKTIPDPNLRFSYP